MVHELESDHMISYSRRFDTQLRENANHIYPHRHMFNVQYISHDHNHINQQPDGDVSAEFYQQATPSATNEYHPESYVDRRTEQLQFEGCLHPHLISPSFLPISSHHELGELEEGVLRLMTAIQYFLQSVTSVSNIGPLEKDGLAMHLKHMLYTTHRSFPAYLIDDATQFVHMLMYKIHYNTADTSIPSSSVPVTSESSFDNCASGSANPSLPASQSYIQDVGKEFESFPSIAQVPPHIQCRFMPQQIYSSRAKADHDRYVKDADLKPAIIFCPKHYDCVGISLRDVLDTRFEDILMDADEVVLDHGPPSAYIRLRVPGYAPDGKQTHQISLKTYERSRNPLTKARLLRSVANAIRKILQKLANEQQVYQHVTDLPFKWTVGKGGDQIGIHNLYIASLHNVSQGTWQPHLYLDPNYPLLH